jgi:hypothetical protein
MPEGLCLEGSLAEKGKLEGFPLGLGKNIKKTVLCLIGSAYAVRLNIFMYFITPF